MKKMSIFFGMWLIILTNTSWAQSANVQVKDAQPAMVVWLSAAKTTNFVFPYGIKSVDKGSKDILVQKATGVENVLQAKAAKPGFVETNLTVITSDGQMYSFIIKYAEQPPLMNIRFEPKDMDKPVVQFSAENDNNALMNRTAERVAAKFPSVKGVKDHKYSILMSLTGLYIENDLYYFQLELENNSNVNYSIDQLRFFIYDLQKAKRTASQELELEPVLKLGNLKVIHGKSKQTVVVSLEKFTIPDQKEMRIQLHEAQGGRHLAIKVGNKQLLKAGFL